VETGTKPEPTPDDRTLAMLAQILQAVSGFWGPLVIYIVKRDNRFVAFHAVQALIWQIGYMVVAFGSMIVFFTGIAFHMPAANSAPPPKAIFIAMPLIWLFFMGGWAVSITLAIIYGIKANRGEWAAYPVIGRWARRIVGA